VVFWTNCPLIDAASLVGSVKNQIRWMRCHIEIAGSARTDVDVVGDRNWILAKDWIKLKSECYLHRVVSVTHSHLKALVDVSTMRAQRIPWLRKRCIVSVRRDVCDGISLKLTATFIHIGNLPRWEGNVCAASCCVFVDLVVKRALRQGDL
jgi:hypothetical protein